MSHEFESGVTFGEVSWHGLENNFAADDPARFDVSLSIDRAGMGWTTRLEPIYTADSSGAPWGIPQAVGQAVVRSDTGKTLGVVGDRYDCLQNREKFEFFQPFLDTKEMSIETAGSLRGGAEVWVLGKLLVDAADVGNGDTLAPYFMLASSHDGSLATCLGWFFVRTVCKNTWRMNFSDKRAKYLKVKHTRNQRKALEIVRETIDCASREFVANADQFRKLRECKISHSDLKQYVKMVFEMPEAETDLSTRSKNKLEEIIQLCVSGAGNTGETVWDGFNGVTDYLSHVASRNDENRFHSVMLGKGKEIGERAFSLALQLAG